MKNEGSSEGKRVPPWYLQGVPIKVASECKYCPKKGTIKSNVLTNEIFSLKIFTDFHYVG